MNCIDFRRLAETEPGCDDPAFIDHAAQCQSCAAFAARAKQFDHLLKAAVKFDVPQDLASRILLREALGGPARERPLRARAFAIAASALLCVGLVFGVWSYVDRGPALDEEMVALIQAAPYALQSTELVGAGAIKAALRPVGLRLDSEMGRVTFASRCYVRGLLSGHVVMRGNSAPITVFLVPGRLATERTEVRSAALSGVIFPVASGTIAIIGAPGEPLLEHEQRITRAIRFEV